MIRRNEKGFRCCVVLYGHWLCHLVGPERLQTDANVLLCSRFTCVYVIMNDIYQRCAGFLKCAVAHCLAMLASSVLIMVISSSLWSYNFGFSRMWPFLDVDIMFFLWSDGLRFRKGWRSSSWFSGLFFWMAFWVIHFNLRLLGMVTSEMVCRSSVFERVEVFFFFLSSFQWMHSRVLVPHECRASFPGFPLVVFLSYV